MIGKFRTAKNDFLDTLVYSAPGFSCAYALSFGAMVTMSLTDCFTKGGLEEHSLFFLSPIFSLSAAPLWPLRAQKETDCEENELPVSKEEKAFRKNAAFRGFIIGTSLSLLHLSATYSMFNLPEVENTVTLPIILPDP